MKKAEIGYEVSNATLRDQDLLRAFSDALEQFQEDGHFQSVIDEARYVASELDKVENGDLPDTLMDGLRDRASWIINEDLFEALNYLAPDGAYFGSHPGDGACFGFWQSEDDWLDAEEQE